MRQMKIIAMKTGIFYGTNSGHSERVALRIGELLHLEDSVFTISDVPISAFLSYDFFIMGTPTWDVGRLQEDWHAFGKLLVSGSLKNKRCALFGLGDQGSYPDTFADGLGILGKIVKNAGVEIVNPWKNQGYDFATSLALENGYFPGLVLDEDCQPDLT